MNQPATALPLEPIGRYVLHSALARGGMATVHAARLVAGEGVSRLVAAKRLHPQYADDPDFIAMFHDEARIASRIHHPNVVPVLDVVRSEDEVILVQEYVHGVPLGHLFKLALAGEPLPIRIAAAIVSGVLAGLHAAHEATDELGEPLGVVHRDVSPQNVIVSVDGVPRLVDFGIAKAKTSVHHTREGFLKGKLAYMAPEQVRAEPVTRRADIYAAGVLLWELVVNRRFYDGSNDAEFVRTIALGDAPTLTEALEPERPGISDERWMAAVRLEPVVTRAMSVSREARWPCALEMAAAVEDAVGIASASEVASWVRSVGADFLEKRQRDLARDQETYLAGHRGSSAPPNSSGMRIEIEDGGRSSGARMRLGASGREHGAHLFDPARSEASDAHTSGLRSAAPTASSARLDQGLQARSLVPWTIVAALLVMVGLLAGVVLVRDRSPSTVAAAASVAPPEQVIFARADLTPASTAPEPAVSAIAAPATSRPPAPAPSTTTTARNVAPPKVATPVVARPSPAPAPTPTPPPSLARADHCSPPFFFDGNKKVFKPSCL